MNERPLARHRVIGDTLWVFIGNLLSQGLGLVSLIVLANVLPPAAFGQFVLAFACVWVLAHGTDPGLTVTFIRLGAVETDRNPLALAGVFRAVLTVKILLLLMVLPAGWGIFLWIGLFDAQADGEILRLILLGGIGLTFWLSVSGFLQVCQRFRFNALVSGVIAGMRLGGILLLISRQMVSVPTSLLIYAVAPFVGILAGAGRIPGHALVSRQEIPSRMGDVIAFGKWVAAVAVCETLFDRMDVMMLGRMDGTEAVGLYTAAKQVASAAPLVTGSIVTALLPKVSRLSDPAALTAFVRQTLRRAIYVLPVVLLLLSLADLLLRLLYVSPYEGVASTFRIVLFALSLNLLIHPIALTLYAMDAPQIRAIIALTQLVIGFFSYLLLIPRFGADGAGLALLTATVVSGGMTLFAVSSRLRKHTG